MKKNNPKCEPWCWFLFTYRTGWLLGVNIRQGWSFSCPADDFDVRLSNVSINTCISCKPTSCTHSCGSFLSGVAVHLKLSVVSSLWALSGTLSGWWFGTFGLFFHILGMTSSQLTNSYFSEGLFSHPPVMIYKAMIPSSNDSELRWPRSPELWMPGRDPKNWWLIHITGVRLGKVVSTSFP